MCWPGSSKQSTLYTQHHPNTPLQERRRLRTQSLEIKIIHKPTPILSQDILSVIFLITMIDWEQAPFVLGAVCRHWRQSTLKTPQLWCRVTYKAASNPRYLRAVLTRSGTALLHVGIPSSPIAELHHVFPAIVGRIVCLRINDRFRFLDYCFPVLERLELQNTRTDRLEDDYGRYTLSVTARFPKLRELCILGVTEFFLQRILTQVTGFRALQALELSCDSLSYWTSIVKTVSNQLISLHLRVLHYLDSCISSSRQFFLPKLRHFRISTYVPANYLSLRLDAPRLESIDERSDLNRPNVPTIHLRYPQSVKELNTGSFPLCLWSYPGLRRLWIRDTIGSKQAMIHSLRTQLHLCLQLKEIIYYNRAEYTQIRPRGTGARWGRCPIPRGPTFWEIWVVVRNSSRDITVRGFLPSDLTLPGSFLPKVRLTYRIT